MSRSIDDEWPEYRGEPPDSDGRIWGCLFAGVILVVLAIGLVGGMWLVGSVT